MSQFIESIKLLDGVVFHLAWHQKRVAETFAKHFPEASVMHLQEILKQQSLMPKGLYKIRVVYDASSYQVSVAPYTKRKINSFELIETAYNYSFKSTHRAFLDNARIASKADEVIFCKEGFITDSSYANLVFFDGQGWFTPTTYLHNGTTRQRLLSENKIQEKPISVESLKDYKKIGFINALNVLGQQTINLKPL